MKRQWTINENTYFRKITILVCTIEPIISSIIISIFSIVYYNKYKLLLKKTENLKNHIDKK